MREQDKADIERIILDRKRANHFFSQRSGTFRTFLAMEEECFKDGALSKAQKEIIATGISIVTDCKSCMEWHVHEALKAGATVDEIVEAVSVAIVFGGGRAEVSSRFVMKVLDHHGRT